MPTSKFFRTHLRKLIVSAFFLALALVLPLLTGQIKQIGNMLCPMHLPVLLCGYLCGPIWGLVVGVTAPLLRFVIFGMPTIMPSGLGMAAELGTYGLVVGLIRYWLRPVAAKGRAGVVLSCYVSLVSAMIAGRLVWGLTRYLLSGLSGSAFPLSAFWAGAVLNAIPGIVLQLILFPLIVPALSRLPVLRAFDE